MTSESAYVWIWLPGEVEPVVAGRIDAVGTSHTFTYGRTYLDRADSIPLYLPELPLQRGVHRPDPSWEAHGCLQDAGPDYWGRRVILAQHFGHLTRESETDDLPFLTYLLESGSDRIGALDFQTSATDYQPRAFGRASMADLLSATDRIEAGQALTPALDEAIFRGTSIGGARPKALIDSPNGRGFIAKFSSTTDPYPVIKAEALAMKLAVEAGINAAPTHLVDVGGRDVLLVERFDRLPGGQRKMLISGLTILAKTPMTGRYGSYPRLADEVRARFTDSEQTLRELFRRIVFNVVVGNTDDHLRNHAAFWDGRMLSLTPAYDICPQPRSGGEVTQALALTRAGDRRSRLQVCEAAADTFQLEPQEALDIIGQCVSTVQDGWSDAADAVGLSDIERARLLNGAILNPSIFYRD